MAGMRAPGRHENDTAGGRETVAWADVAPCSLAECPVGLFLFGNTLGVKTEYATNEGRIDAYIVQSGEFFWGDLSQTIESQRACMVVPLRLPTRDEMLGAVITRLRALEEAATLISEEAHAEDGDNEFRWTLVLRQIHALIESANDLGSRADHRDAQSLLIGDMDETAAELERLRAWRDRLGGGFAAMDGLLSYWKHAGPLLKQKVPANLAMLLDEVCLAANAANKKD